MGDFRIVIEAAGPHGCDRETKSGRRVSPCHYQTCPDCMAREFVNYLRIMRGFSVSKAELVHWPADMENRPTYTKEGEIRDNLLTGVRSGSFR